MNNDIYLKQLVINDLKNVLIDIHASTDFLKGILEKRNSKLTILNGDVELRNIEHLS